MKKQTMILLLGSALVAQAQQFNGTSYNTRTGEVDIISGFVDCNQTQVIKPESQLEKLRATRARIQADTDRILAEMAASRAQAQLEEQTRLLRKIANE